MKVGKDGEFRSHLPSLLDGFLDCRMPCMHGPVDHAVLDGGLMDHQVRLATHLAELEHHSGLVTNSCPSFRFWEQAKQMSFLQIHNHGLRQSFLKVSWVLRA